MYAVDQIKKTFTEVPSHLVLTLRPEHKYWVHGLPEHRQIDWMCNTFGDPAKTAVDIGAHTGTWSISLAAAFGAVHSFEPNPEVYFTLCANLGLRKQFNVETHRVCLGDAPAEVDYVFRSADGGGNGVRLFDKDKDQRVLKMPLRTLDSFNLQDVAFVKIDVEGFEQQVLAGARETIRRCQPAIVVEAWEDWREREGVPAAKLKADLFAFVRQELGYRSIRSIIGHAEMFLCEP